MDELVIVTGGSSGIGAALVATVPFDPVTVIDVSRRGGTGASDHWRIDLATPSGWELLEDRLVERLAGFEGRVVLVHSAATLAPIGFVGEVDSAAYFHQVLLDSAAPQAVGQAFLRALDGAGDVAAHLWMLTSGRASKPTEQWSGYCAGKAALDQWTRTVGAEQRARGNRCRLLALAPGSVETPLHAYLRSVDGLMPEAARIAAQAGTDHMRDPMDVARQMWSLLDRDLDNGAVLDLRDL